MDDKVLEKLSTRIADKAYIQDFKGDLFCLIKDYFEKSKDKNSTPGAVLLDMIDHAEDPAHVVIVHESEGKPDGFLIGKVVGNTARILMAFLGRGLDNKKVIRDSLVLFEGWAYDHKCVALDLYTHRHPKSYKSLTDLGWRHNYTVYRKDFLAEGTTL